MFVNYVGRRTDELPLIAPGLKYIRGVRLSMAREVGAGTADSFDVMHCGLVDSRATKPYAAIWGHNYGILMKDHCEKFVIVNAKDMF